MERIVAAAIRLQNDVYGGDLIISQLPPARHFTLLHPLYDKGIIVSSLDQGFITSLGRYVDREEAYRIAIEAGQHLTHKGLINGSKLYSEDLW